MSWVIILELAAETLSSFFVVLFPGLVGAGETAQSALSVELLHIPAPFCPLSFCPLSWSSSFHRAFKVVCAKTQSLSPVIGQTPISYFSPGNWLP